MAVTVRPAQADDGAIRAAVGNIAGSFGPEYYQEQVDSGGNCSQLVVARNGRDEASGRGLLSVFMVPTQSPGLKWSPIRTVMNLPDRSHQVYFDNVEVPTQDLVGAQGRGLAVAFAGLNAERTLTSSICTGSGRYAIRKAADYANNRLAWGRPIGAHQAIAHPLAAAHMRLAAAQLVTD